LIHPNSKNGKQEYAGKSYFVYNKKSKESYFLKKHEIFTPQKVSTSTMPINDLDGLKDPYLYSVMATSSNKKNEVYNMSILAIPDIMEYFDTKIIEPDKLATQKYYNRVKKLLDESTIEDNPIIRICYLK